MTEMGQGKMRRIMRTLTSMEMETKMDKKKEFTNNMMETTKDIFLKMKKAPIEQILSVE